MPRTRHPCPSPVLAGVENLYARFDGPPGPSDVLSTVTGEPALALRRRALSREIDRSARDLAASISSVRAGISRAASGPGKASPLLEELAHCLRYYRELGVELPPGRRHAGRPRSE